MSAFADLKGVISRLNEDEKTALRVKIGTVLRPGTPVNRLTLFSGRKSQITSVIDGIIQAGRHVIIFGERGVGKTSLTKIISEILSNAGIEILSSGTITCDSTDDFDSIWRKAFREITVAMRVRKIGFRVDPYDEMRSLNSMLPEELISPDDIRYLLNQITGTVVVILDEVDKIPDKATTNLLAETIKNLSDNTVDATLILVGVADDVTGLIQGHRSIERVMVQVRMERMSTAELEQIIKKGFSYAGMTIDEDASDRITRLSHGLPHYTHLLGLTSAVHAIDDDRTHVEMADVTASTKDAVEQSHSLLDEYIQATTSPQKSLHSQALLACALTKPDALGYFSAADVAKPFSVIMGKKCSVTAFAKHLKAFCSEERGQILQTKGLPRGYRYRFANPLMQPFVLIHGLANEFMAEELLWVAAR